jgi:hypothetical protein
VADYEAMGVTTLRFSAPSDGTGVVLPRFDSCVKSLLIACR